MISGPKDPFERAEAIKKLEERWLLKSKEIAKDQPPVSLNPKKSRTSLTNPIIKNNPTSRQGKNLSA